MEFAYFVTVGIFHLLFFNIFFYFLVFFIERIFLSEIFVEDCRYFNDGTTTTGLTIGTGVTCIVEDNSYIKITKSTNGEAYVTFPPSLTNLENFIIEWELAKKGTQDIGVYVYTGSTTSGLWVAYDDSYFSGGLRGSVIPNYYTTFEVGDKLKIQQLNGVISIYKNNELIYSKTTSFQVSTYKFGNYTNNNRVQYIKNIKLKAL